MIQIIQNKKCKKKKKKKLSENYWLSRRKHGYHNNSHDNILINAIHKRVSGAHDKEVKIVMMYTKVSRLLSIEYFGWKLKLLLLSLYINMDFLCT